MYHIISEPNGNAKLSRMPDGVDDVVTTGIAIAPASIGGHEVCNWRGSCAALCIGINTGRNRMQNVRDAQVRRKRILRENPEAFRYLVIEDVERYISWAERNLMSPYFRPHMYSDMPESPRGGTAEERVRDYRWLARMYPKLGVYGYTKHPTAYRWKFPANYSLTYSWSEKSNVRTAEAYLKRGHNVSVVFAGDPPGRFDIGRNSYKVIDGDAHDYRVKRFDGQGNIIGLKFKGGAASKLRGIKSGFVNS